MAYQSQKSVTRVFVPATSVAVAVSHFRKTTSRAEDGGAGAGRHSRKTLSLTHRDITSCHSQYAIIKPVPLSLQCFPLKPIIPAMLMKKIHHIGPINGVLGFPLSAQMKIVSPVVERGNGQVAVCSVFSFFPMRSRRSVEGSGMQHIAGCLGLLARSSDWSCVCLCMPGDLNGELSKLISCS